MKSVFAEDFKSQLEMSELKRLRLQRQSLMESVEFENLSYWTMLDLMTLILVFFIILYTDLLLQNSPKHLMQDMLTSTISQTSNVQDQTHTNNPILKNLRTTKTDDFLTVEKKLHGFMNDTDLSNYTVKTIGNRTMLTIGENLSFPVAQAQLLDHIKPALRKIASFLNRENAFKIVVSGHTDNTPIHTQKYVSNWELSVARALSVAKFLIGAGVDPLRVSVEGFGQYRPLEDNDSFEGRQANRRVEISLIQE